MYIKVHKLHERVIVAICDEDLLGKRFEEKEHLLEIPERFFKGEKKSKEDMIPLIKKAHIINLVGKESVQFGIQNKLIDKNNIKTVKNIPHAQAILL